MYQVHYRNFLLGPQVPLIEVDTILPLANNLGEIRKYTQGQGQ
jgi:hypothetical protein